MILVDNREQAPLRFSAAVDVEVVCLPVGDYSVRGSTEVVALERKRLGELATCCGTDRERFIEQIERMRVYPVRGLIIEADLDGVLSKAYASQINPLSVLGTLIKFSSDWQVPIWFAGDARNAAHVVERILLRVHKQTKERAA
ncbi:MAG: ERCC4 domain-containing protein [Polyangiaceae bacterium]